MSSANSLGLETKFQDKSFIYIKESGGPRIKPWGSSASTLTHVEFWTSRTTLCFLSFRNLSFIIIWTYLLVRACIVWKSNQMTCKGDRLTGFCVVRFFLLKSIFRGVSRTWSASRAKMFVKLINGFRPLASLVESSVADVWLQSWTKYLRQNLAFV